MDRQGHPDRREATRETRLTLSIAWSFVLFNYIYADFGFFARIMMDPAMMGRFQALGQAHYSQWAMLALAAMMEIPIAMVLLSWLLRRKANRIANIAAGIAMTLVILFTLFGGGRVPPLDFYSFFQAIEIAATVAIVCHAWRWREPDRVGDGSGAAD
ncbi:MAG TPA: DUF6326 family protein [Allosphingosinicella sp.]|nr:DUF6326 family protein [Allosphingosinicella sp.]